MPTIYFRLFDDVKLPQKENFLIKLVTRPSGMLYYSLDINKEAP